MRVSQARVSWIEKGQLEKSELEPWRPTSRLSAACHERCDGESTRLNVRSAHEAQAHLDVRTAGVWQDHPGEQIG
jgi:hypothetical protein